MSFAACAKKRKCNPPLLNALALATKAAELLDENAKLGILSQGTFDPLSDKDVDDLVAMEKPLVKALKDYEARATKALAP